MRTLLDWSEYILPFPGYRVLGDTRKMPKMELIGLNPESCIECGAIIPDALRLDKIYLENNVLIIETGTKCILCRDSLGPDKFMIHFCEKCGSILKVNKSLFNFNNYNNKFYCDNCFREVTK
jgi:hypothetical protein